MYFEMSRIIRERRCNFVLCENVRGAVNLALDTVCANLEDSGYEVWPYVIPANAFGAPHERYRLVVIGVRKDVADACRKRLQGSQRSRGFAVQGSSPFGATTQRGQVGGRSEELADTRSEGRERGSGLPYAEERVHGGCASAGRGKEPRPNWPTITVNGNNNRKGISKKAGDGLATAARNWPTLRAGGLCGGTGNYNAVRSVFDKDTTRAFTSNNGGQLNPEWCEIFLGAPMGWTDLSVPNEELQYLGFPMGMGLEQHDWEPPRLLERGVKVPFKKERIRCLGNAVVPDQFIGFFRAIKYMNDLIKGEGGQ